MKFKNWVGLEINDSLEENIKEICLEFIERLKEPEDAIKNNDLSLAGGVSGIIILLNEINRVLKIDTKDLIHKYICYSKDYIHSNLSTFSLYEGVAGFNYAIFLINEHTGNYSKLLLQLDNILIVKINEFLDKSIKNNLYSKEIKYSFEFDVISGLAGVSRYVLTRKDDNEDMKSLCYKLASYFVLLCKDKNFKEKRLKGWASKKIDVDTQNNVKLTDEIEYNLGIAHGVSGILCILSLFLINNIEVEGEKEAIENIVNWLIEIDKNMESKLWPHAIDASNYELTSSRRVAWCYGSPGIASALYLSSKALNDEQVHNLSNKVFERIFDNPIDEWNISSPMICHGYSGLLNILVRISDLETIKKRYKVFIEDILNNIDYNKNFCFKNIDIIREYDSPGFLMGSSGIILSLLSILSKTSPRWDEVLLIN